MLSLAIFGIVVLLYNGLSGTAGEMQKFYCFGPSKPPMQMSASEQARWACHQQTPVIFNHHAPIEINSSSIQHVDLNKVKSTTQAVLNEERSSSSLLFATLATTSTSTSSSLAS